MFSRTRTILPTRSCTKFDQFHIHTYINNDNFFFRLMRFPRFFVCVARVCTRNETTDRACVHRAGACRGVRGGPLLASASAGLAGDLNFLWCEPTSPPSPPFCSSDRLLPVLPLLVYAHRPLALFSAYLYIYRLQVVLYCHRCIWLYSVDSWDRRWILFRYSVVEMI